VKLHGFIAVASAQTGFRGAEPRTVRLRRTGAWVKSRLFEVVLLSILLAALKEITEVFQVSQIRVFFVLS